ncbi:ArsC family reductase [Haliscomenobacter hydrossis]|uniref:ArsC family protein n=1 Tax=Haliscomenobacter hydrossis (strain ATCC 27775 / DSM 1100 / LMG 10767 / O) TaxID=760192 RepID=F4L1K4_HALH1|nr:ArsC family reductase [Haliscomenobacter hydrossis]AEE48548.1 ArsC family protein [Haliscomenobacter hydrossis DSM 1100]
MLTIYGIPNCDTVKKARTWLENHGINYTFHDYKLEGLSPEKLAQWLQQRAWTEVLNARSTTWRELPQATKDTVIDADSAATVLLENLSMIKRPLVEQDGKVLLIGFDQKQWEVGLRDV